MTNHNIDFPVSAQWGRFYDGEGDWIRGDDEYPHPTVRLMASECKGGYAACLFYVPKFDAQFHRVECRDIMRKELERFVCQILIGVTFTETAFYQTDSNETGILVAAEAQWIELERIAQ